MEYSCRDLFNKNHMQIVTSDITRDQLFLDVSEKLKNQGFVNDNYYDELKKREQVYPTGLKLETCSVAIPHVNSEFANKSTIYVSLLKNKTIWDSMENPEDKLQVSVVFNICLAEMGAQPEILSAIIAILQRNDIMERLLNCQTTDQMEKVLREED